MSQPTPYERLYSFTDWQTVNPSKPLPGSELDAELNAIKLTSDQTRANLAVIQRDDGKLANGSVLPESLSAGALAMIYQGVYNPRGTWAGSTAYESGDLVTHNAATYLCLIAHTSNALLFTTDLTAARWMLIANGALSGDASLVSLFSGNGTQKTFTLPIFYANNNAATVFVSGVAKTPGQDFSIVGNLLTFVSAPPPPDIGGSSNIMVRGTGVEAQLASDAAAGSAAQAQTYATAAGNSAAAAAASAASAQTNKTASDASATAAHASELAAAASALEAQSAVSSTNLPISLIGASKRVLRVKPDESGYELVVSAALPTFYGLVLSADGTELISTVDRTGSYKTSDFVSWFINENVSLSIENNELVMTI